MSEAIPQYIPELEKRLWQIYRDFFDKAERKRRWNVRESIPWDECNPNISPAIADVVESFCAVELYLPDYVSKILPMVRASRGRAWFYGNWGYEESKHSLVLHDWLLRSGARTEEQMADLESKVFAREWNLPQGSHLGMLTYAMVQEHATFINYRNLRNRVAELGRDPALEKLLNYLAIDEAAHHGFFYDCFVEYLKYNREATIDSLREVLHNFAMPAIYDLLDESAKRQAAVRELDLFSEEIFFRDVYYELLNKLGISRAELRGRKPSRISLTK